VTLNKIILPYASAEDVRPIIRASRKIKGKTSAKSQSRHSDRAPLTSGLSPTPDILRAGCYVSKVP